MIFPENKWASLGTIAQKDATLDFTFPAFRPDTCKEWSGAQLHSGLTITTRHRTDDNDYDDDDFSEN